MAPYFLLNFYGISSASRFMNVLAWLRGPRSLLRAEPRRWQSHKGRPAARRGQGWGSTRLPSAQGSGGRCREGSPKRGFYRPRHGPRRLPAAGTAPRCQRRRSAPAGLPCAWACSEFGVPALGTYRLMSQDFLTLPGVHNSEDRLLRRHPNPLAIVPRFGG